MRSLVLSALFAFAAASRAVPQVPSSSVAAESFMVYSADDNSDNDLTDGYCDSAKGCTLRAAIEQANATSPEIPVTIWFNLSQPAEAEIGGVWYIQPKSALPVVTKRDVTFDGTTMAGASCGTLTLGGAHSHIMRVVLDGHIHPESRSGFDFQASATGGHVKGLVINQFERNGIVSSADNLTVECVYLGTNYLGTEARPNRWNGVLLREGNNAKIRNSLISGNTLAGIWPADAASNTKIEGNVIGARIGTFDPLPNGYGIRDSGTRTTIGGTAGGSTSKMNIIANNSGDGVRLYDNASAVIFGNSIFGNGELGIDLNNDGVTPNDVGDADSGPNDLQNYPESLLPTYLGGRFINVRTVLRSLPFQNYAIDFFASPAPDLSGYGEGKTPLGGYSYWADAAGTIDVLAAPAKGSVAVGDWLTATATRILANSVFQGTSEFSPAAQVLGPNVTLTGKVLLEGPYVGPTMDVPESFSSERDLEQPYRLHPWQYKGRDAVTAIPAGVVDWVLITLRVSDPLNINLPGAVATRKAAFVAADGSLIDLDGSNEVGFYSSWGPAWYWVQIEHRNHISILSSIRVYLDVGIGYWDFTQAGKAYSTSGPPMQNLGDGKYGMYACDIVADGAVDQNDAASYKAATGSGVGGYVAGDCNLDGSVDALDYNLYLANAIAGASSHVP